MGEPNELSAERIAEINARVERWSSTTGEALLRFVTPLYRGGPRHPELFGSGILVDATDGPTVVTAGHVLDELSAGSSYHFAARGQLLPLIGWRTTTKVPPGLTREADRIDLGFMRLDSPAADHLQQADLLGLDLVETVDERAPEGLATYFVSGYPASRQPRRLVDNAYEANSFAFVTEEASGAEYEEAGISPRERLFLHYRKDDIVRAGEALIGPDLFGLSGSAVWRLWPDRSPTLTGVVTTWRRGAPPGIIATPTPFVLHALAARTRRRTG